MRSINALKENEQIMQAPTNLAEKPSKAFNPLLIGLCLSSFFCALFQDRLLSSSYS